MSRTSIAIVLGMLLLAARPVRADEAQTVQEIRELKQLIEQQMKRIDELTVEVGRLHQAVEAQKAALTSGPSPKRDVVGPPPFSGLTEMKPEIGKPASRKTETAAKTESPATEPAADVPKAELVNGLKHTVAKGETLTSIAKHYNIPLADLQKANKSVIDRKLQIGQTLTIPVTKSTEPAPTEKKENP